MTIKRFIIAAIAALALSAPAGALASPSHAAASHCTLRMSGGIYVLVVWSGGSNGCTVAETNLHAYPVNAPNVRYFCAFKLKSRNLALAYGGPKAPALCAYLNAHVPTGWVRVSLGSGVGA